jgi:SAM-dependent methyltransferase
MDTFNDALNIKSRAKKTYETIEKIWPETDAWSIHTRHNIAECVSQFIGFSHDTILNAGCGDNDYGFSRHAFCVNLDMALRQCRNLKQAVVADIETLPFPTDHFQATVCVGAVLNYVEPYNAIPELVRVTKPGGIILLDFETTHTAEIIFSKHWGKRVSVIERSYAGRLDKTFLFSAEHIKRILSQDGIELLAAHHYHTTTAIWQRVFPDAALPLTLLRSDRWLSRIPGLRTLASNVIFACRKC